MKGNAVKAKALIVAMVAMGACGLHAEITFSSAKPKPTKTIDVCGEDWGVAGNEKHLWVLMACKTECNPTNLMQGSIAFSGAAAATLETNAIPDGVEYVWRNFYPPYKDVVETVWMSVVNRKGEGDKLRWRLGATMKPGWAAYHSAFPNIVQKGLLGKDDRILSGADTSGVILNPGDPKARPKALLFANRQPATLIAQFMCRYTDDRLFYFACEDGQGWDKGCVGTRMDNGNLNLYYVLRGWFEGTWTQPYDIVTCSMPAKKGEVCDWRDAADLYREWAEKQRFCKAKLMERKDLADFYRQAPVMYKFNRKWLEKPDFTRKSIDKRRIDDGLDGIPVIGMVTGWEKWWEWVGPDYFPMFPTDKSTKELFMSMRGKGIRPFLWPSTYNCTLKYRLPDYVSGKRSKPDDPLEFDHTAAFVAAGLEKHCSLDEKGVWEHDSSWLGPGCTMGTLCTADPFTREWFAKSTVSPCMERGATILQMDQFNMCMWRSCWSRDHGHLPHTGLWKTEGARENMRHANALMRTYDPEGVIAFEGPNEQFIDLIAVQDVRNCRYFDGEWANVYTYLYHEYALAFQAGIHPNRFWIAQSAAEGQIPYFPSSIDSYDESGALKDKLLHDFTVAWIKLWRGEGKPYLAYGRHVRPPRIECDRLQYKDNWRGNKIDMMMPAVFHAEYEAKDGSRAIVLVNATDEPRSGALLGRKGKTKFDLGPREIRMLKK